MVFPETEEEAFLLRIYEERMQESVLSFLHRPVNTLILAQIKNALSNVQTNFLFENPDYVAARPISVTEYEHGRLDIDAPICTVQFKNEMEHREKLLRKELALADSVMNKRWANLQRKHRKLYQRYADVLTPGIKSIWRSLNVGQQYAILKDVDYAQRHKTR